MRDSETEAFLQNLPQLAPDETFRFNCDPSVSCFNVCCADLDLALSPYDVLRLCRALDVTGRAFLAEHTTLEVNPEDAVPMVYLKMLDEPGSRCPFVAPQGCTVYTDRPSACRIYPLGRGATVQENGEVTAQYVVLCEDHCRGFRGKSPWTSAAWVKDQNLGPYNALNDSYLTLLGFCQTVLPRMSAEQCSDVLLELYRLDEFRARLKDEQVLERLSLPADQMAIIESDDTACLLFAIKWARALLSQKAKT